ncbi:MAG: alpha/beta fold hydrolase [Deltaproteobacteria bacterium]|nr:alpha/beta fold hydrolase [Deltaproteobacteria bacterium]
MKNRRPFTTSTDGGVSLHGLVDLPESASAPSPVVVLCHGFKGFMEWGFFPYLAELLAARGFIAVRFNFSGSGMLPGEERVADLEAFRANSFSADLADLLVVLDSLEEITDGRGDLSRLGLMGHSRGGGIALLAAAREEWMTRVSALVTWASIGTCERFSEAQRQTWRQQGVLKVVNGRTGQELPMGLELLDDMENHGGRLDLEQAARRRRAPWLLVHGEDDETVPAKEARQLSSAATDPSQLEIIESGNHTFGSQHPFSGPSRPLIETMNHTQKWFRRFLGT